MHFEDLSLRHQTFLSEYVQNGFNATKAYRDVYENNDPDSAAACSSRLLSNDKIQLALEELVNKLTPEYILASIHSIARDSIRPSDKLRALELLGKYHALFKDTSQNLNLNGILTVEDLQAIRQRLPAKQGMQSIEDKRVTEEPSEAQVLEDQAQ